jgi:hypothetical protein
MIRGKLIVLTFLMAWSQMPGFSQDTVAIGLVEVYGARTVSESSVRKALGVEAGQNIPLDSITIVQLKKRLTAIPGVKRSDIGLICCWGNEGKWLLFAGVSEQAKDQFSYNPKPSGSTRLPQEIVDNSGKLDSARYEAVKQNDAVEDDSQGHALMNNVVARHFQEKYIDYANQSLPILRTVLHTSSSDDDRAIAAEVIAYAKNKKDIVDDLLQAVHDPSHDVRNNATRALGVLTEYAESNPGLGIIIPGTTFVEMLNSLVWTDRNKALMVLMPLTYHRNPVLLQQLKKEALPSLIEMAKWKDPGHMYPAYALLGRIAGFPDDKISKAFFSSGKDEYLKKIIRAIH